MFSANTCSEHFFVIFSPLFQNLTELSDCVPSDASASNKLMVQSPSADVSYTTTGNTTGAQILQWLRTNIDKTKLTPHSKVMIGGYSYTLTYRPDNSSLGLYTAVADASSPTVSAALTNYTNASSDIGL